MAERRYKIIISNKNIYREIELTKDTENLKVGTDVDCEVRLHKNIFFEKIELSFIKNGEEWSVICSDNLYLTVGDIRKLMTMSLSHGDTFEVRYQESNNLAFNVSFLIDFDNGKRKYERIVDISSRQVITIGALSSDNIVLKSQFIKNDAIELVKTNNSLVLRIKNSEYGVFHNGKRAENEEEIKNGDFFSLSDFFFYYKNGRLWTEIREDLLINGLSYVDHRVQNSYPKFSRNTRVKTVLSDSKIEILDPPAKLEKPKNNIFMRLLPSFGMLLASAVMGFMGGTMIIFSVISGGMAIFTTIMGIKEGNKDYKLKAKDRIEKYNNYIENKEEEIEQCRKEEKEALEEIYVSQSVEQQRFDTFSPYLFERTKSDEDFLCVRLGSGLVEAKRLVEYKKQEKLEVEDDLQTIPERMQKKYRYLKEAPIVCDFKSVNAVGIVGLEKYRFEFLKNIVIDIVARQYFTDVKMVFVTKEENREKVHWLRMLPNVYSDQLKTRMIVSDDESKNLIFEYLYKELTIREQNKGFEENIIVFLYDEYGFKSHPISKFTDKAKSLGVTFVFFGENRKDIPQGCAYIVDIKDEQNALLINTEDGNNAVQLEYPTIRNEQAQNIVKILAPVYTEEISLESTLTKSISMFELLNILAVDDIDLKTRWSKSQVFKSMAAPMGVSKTGIVNLDLHDKAHGPHGLVAGTTGSGKSEILQTYILAMATLYHPYEVGFVIIDFKGGGMVNQFKGLPHLLGAITNIDGKEIDRSLKSIKAELQKRQRLFAESDVNHIDKYIKKFRAGEVSEPLPHLIIIVDEFAELKAEQPEFMKELISAARIGRSLGVHLILATQKPSGQVNEQIWSNSRFKLCLKVQSQEDSNEVLKSPLAAEIKEPGRAYLQVGNNEIFELFQSAYSGVSEKADENNVKEFTIYSISETGKRTPVYEQKKKKGEEGSATQLDAIVRYVDKYCKDNQIKKLPDICLPSLSDHIDFVTGKDTHKDSSSIIADIGIYDDPDNQYQGVYSLDVANQNVMIIGSAQSGKTNVLQNIIRSIASKYTPDEVSIYIMDFASMVLKNYEKLHHVGGVVCSSDDEKLKNLFKLLYSEIEVRKEKLISVGVSSFAAYKEAGKKDIPQIVLIIDNLTALKELYFQDDDELLNLCREGLTVGISVIIANAQTSGIGYKYLSNFSTRIAMYCNDSGEYSSLFEHCREKIENIPGRCLIKLENKHLECQTYLAFEGEKEIERVEKIRSYISSVNAENRNSMARIIPLIPNQLTTGYLVENFSHYMENRFSVVTGLDYASVTPFVVNFANLGMMAIIGREKSGKHNFIKYSLHMLEKMYPEQIKIYVVDGINKKLGYLKNQANVSAYSIIPEDAVTYVKEIEDELKQRYDALVAGDEEIISNSKLLILLLDNVDAVNAICNDTTALNAYKNIIGRYKNMNACVLVSSVDNANIPYSAPEIFKNIRDTRHMMYFDDMCNMKIFDVPLSMSKRFKKPIEIGDTYYIKENDCTKLKTAICPNVGE